MTRASKSRIERRAASGPGGATRHSLDADARAPLIDMVRTRGGGTIAGNLKVNRLYKFLPNNYAEAMCERGEIRVGTLHEYRNGEQYSGGILDREEGVLDYVDNVISARGDSLNPLWLRLMGMAPNKTNIFGCCRFSTRLTEPDQLIYCTSVSSEWHVQLFEEHPNYDTCVEIVDVPGFIEAVALLFSDVRTPVVEFASCLYRERDHSTVTFEGVPDRRSPPRPAFLKPQGYSAWKEFRIVMDPLKQPPKAETRSSADLAKCCRIYSSRPARKRR